MQDGRAVRSNAEIEQNFDSEVSVRLIAQRSDLLLAFVLGPDRVHHRSDKQARNSKNERG